MVLEPATIVTLATGVGKVVFTVSESLYTFISKANKVDQSIKHLHAEIRLSYQTLNAVQGALSNSVVTSALRDHAQTQEILEVVQGSIQECQVTADALAETLNDIPQAAQSRNPFKQSWKQVKLDLNEGQIKELRSQFQVHCISLQTSLQSINLIATCAVPGRILQRVPSMYHQMKLLCEKLEALDQMQIPSSQAPISFRVDRIKRSARAVISSASTIIEDENLSVGAVSEREFTTGSEYGDPLTTANWTRIEGWIQPPILEECSERDESVPLARPEEDSQSPGKTKSDMGGLDTEIFRQPPQAEDSKHNSDEDDVDYDIVERYLAKGTHAFESLDFKLAHDLLCRGLRRSMKLSSRQRQRLNLTSSQWTLSLTYLQLRNIAEAKKIFKSITGLQLNENREDKIVFSAYHSLALLHIMEENIEAAENYCRQSLKGRKRVLGKDSPAYYSSVKLMASIYRRKGDESMSADYAVLLPAGFMDEDQDCKLAAEALRLHDQAKNRKAKELAAALSDLREAGFDLQNGGWSTHDALLWAFRHSNDAAIEYLLDWGANINSKNKKGDTILISAIKEANENDGRVIEEILKRGADANLTGSGDYSPLYHAAACGDDHCALMLLEKGVSIASAHPNGWNALHMASMGGHESTVRLLLEKGADIASADQYGLNALHRVSERGHDSIVRLLLEKGADIEATHRDGWNALHIASLDGRDSTVRLLLEKGANIAATSKDGFNALHVAAMNGHDSTVRVLLESRANIEAVDCRGGTALHRASQKGHDSTVRLLLEKGGADVNALTHLHHTSLDIAIDKGFYKVSEILRDAGGKTSEKLTQEREGNAGKGYKSV